MGGVDKSDQYLSYHSILRKTVRYWKTPFYHLVDLCVVNAFILYNWITHEAGGKVISENDFRDALVCQIIYYYGREREKVSCGRPCKSDCRVKHGSVLFPLEQKARCQYCRMHSIVNWTQRKCPDCPNTPALCQTTGRDCHAKWHLPSFDEVRDKWFEKKASTEAGAVTGDSHAPEVDTAQQKTKCGRLRGAINKCRRRGNYRSK